MATESVTAIAVTRELAPRRRDVMGVVFSILLLGALLLTLVILITLLIDQLSRALPVFQERGIDFLTSDLSSDPSKAGVAQGIVGSIVIGMLVAVLCFPLGILTAVYLEEYAPANRFTRFINVNIRNLAGVPSIVYGLLALGLFVYQFGLGHSIIAAGLTLALLILPVVIVATREAIRSIPQGIREGAYALGATQWQVCKDHIIPYSMPGILTGVIIGMARAIGETAPIITIGALTFIAFVPPAPVKSEPPFVSFEWLFSPFTVMPIQMFNWTSRPEAGFHQNAAGRKIRSRNHFDELFDRRIRMLDEMQESRA